MTTPEDAQQATVEFLKARLGPEVEVSRTHISVILLGRDTVWKLKRAVTLPYVDFTLSETRLRDCERELDLNRRTAPTLYRAVRRVTRTSDGLELDGAGELVDAVVEMARFPSDALLDRMAGRGELTPRLVTRLAGAVAALHETAPVDRAGSGAARLAAVMAGNERSLREASAFEPRAVKDYCAAAGRALDRHAALLDARARAGAVVRGHGDLHLANICLWDGEPTLFDCLEFDDELATTDRLYDLAFLLMDLWRLDLRALANLALNRYLDRIDDEDGLGALPLFMSVRAAVRAHVAALQAGSDAAKLGTARNYLALARRLLEPQPPKLVAIGGFSGSGKSTVAAALAHDVGPPPGARILASDRIRKAMFGQSPETALPAEAYWAEVTAEVYDRIAVRAQAVLKTGHGVVAEATFSSEAERLQIEAAAGEAAAAFQGVWLDVDERRLRERVLRRRGDVSDADVAVLDRQLERGAGTVDWRRVDATGDAAAIAAGIRADG
ncbi:AAA family ATPase [Hansschlegelia plantiphila]|uniref:DNA-binding protein n=1 Tax=Hansschlegelia plantiphila TaxID=374655 RepID=A0A9W6MW17_9HYPH|nr:AAA family ATPase [Hansschlegelia plantiphila]GLK68516.1 DNA-binding protein [Hansschlegelia plantiphila]